MADVDVVDPELEVRKLQDLVRKLEQQNDILRAKQNKQNNTIILPASDDLEIIDSDTLNDLNLNNEETWLYQSPKALTPDQKKKSPYQWARETFDENTSPEFESVRKSLLLKLDEVTTKGRLSRSSSGNALSFLALDDAQASPVLQSRTNINLSPGQGGGVPSIKKPLVSYLNNRVDTNTFTRPKKHHKQHKSSHVDWDGPISFDGPIHINNNNHAAGSSFSVDQQNENNNRQDSRLSESRLSQSSQAEKKVLDVHILAKMQEESLRQSFSPLTSRRRSSRGKAGGFFLSQQLSNESDTNVSPWLHDSNRSSSPSHLEGELPPPPRKISSATSQASVSTASLNSNGSSTGSTPPDSLHEGNHGDAIPQQSRIAGRNSVPNLRSYNTGLRQNNSDSNLQYNSASGSGRYSPGNGRYSPQSRATGVRSPSNLDSNRAVARQPSPSNLKQPAQVQRAISPPSRSGIPGPGRTGIPRPGSAPKSGLPTPRRASLPASMPTVRNGRNNNFPMGGMDESWKEGCF